MRYAMLICTDEKLMEGVSDADAAAAMARYETFMKEMASRGVLQGGERLRPVADATTVRVRDGETLASDGPFAETKEQVGGYFIVDCKDLDEAIEIAAKIPGAAQGSIEVRPIWEMWSPVPSPVPTRPRPLVARPTSRPSSGRNGAAWSHRSSARPETGTWPRNVPRTHLRWPSRGGTAMAFRPAPGRG